MEPEGFFPFIGSLVRVQEKLKKSRGHNWIIKLSQYRVLSGEKRFWATLTGEGPMCQILEPYI